MDSVTLANAVRRLGMAYPDAKCALQGAKDEFSLLVGLILNSRTRTEVAEQALTNLMQLAGSPHTLAMLGVDRILEAIGSVAYPTTKASRLIHLCFVMLDKHAGGIPAERKSLERLPGVGPKIASLFLNLARGKPEIAFDSHVLRLCRRLSGKPASKAIAFEQALIAHLEQHEQIAAHHWMAEHARTICKPRKPDCRRCIVASDCASADL